MANKSLQHSSLTDNIFYRSMLAGNAAYFPEFESDDFLEEVVITSPATSVTFSGLDSYATAGYKHLQIRAVGRSDRAASQDALYMRFNSDTGSNYATHYLLGSGSTVSSGSSVSTAYIQPMVLTGATDTPTTGFDAAIIDLLDFSNSSKNTTIRALNGKAGTVTAIRLWSGFWNNTAAVTSISLTTFVGQLVAGSRFSLYGSKG